MSKNWWARPRQFDGSDHLNILTQIFSLKVVFKGTEQAA